MWSIYLSKQANDFLNKQDKHIKERLEARLTLLKENPFHYLSALRGEYYKFRIGEYRAILDIDFPAKHILILVLEHRKRVYKQ